MELEESLILPLNRKEKYWTSCVLPSIICGENKFCDLKEFLKLIKVPKRFIKENYEFEDIEFYTEYCLRDSAVKGVKSSKVGGETPDLVIILKNKNESFLIFVEAKMYDKVTSKKMRDQLNKQKKIANVIIEEYAEINKDNFIHVALFLQQPSKFEVFEEEVMINWTQIRDSYQMKSNNYFHKMLSIACNRTDLISKGAHSFGENGTGCMGYEKIVETFKEKEDFYVGRRGAIKQVKKDCEDKVVTDWDYEVNTKLKPGFDKPPGTRSVNWLKASEFVSILKQYKII